MLAITNGRVLTITGGMLEHGTVLIDGDKIAAVGTDVEIPDGAEIIDAAGKWVTPGLIDAHSHIGLFGEPRTWATADGNETTNPVTPQLRGIDSLNPDDPSFADVLAAGVTCVYTQPGSANIIGGTGVAIKLSGETVDEMVIPGTEGMKMALGENPKRVYGVGSKKTPATRMANAAVLREALVSAQNYLNKIEKARAKAEKEGDEEPDLPERDLRWEALGKVLTGEMSAHIHCHRADDILTAIRVAEEFKIRYSLEHVTEGYKIKEILVDKGVPCIVGPLLMARGKMEIKDVTLANPGILARAGVKVCIQMDGASSTQWLPVVTGLAVREGMPEDEAMRAITINPAEVLGIADRVGSLEAGKDADVAIFDDNPLLNYSKCVATFVEGRAVYELEKE
ncbi:MAG: amidohydrolase [Bacillota bacterium]